MVSQKLFEAKIFTKVLISDWRKKFTNLTENLRNGSPGYG